MPSQQHPRSAADEVARQPNNIFASLVGAAAPRRSLDPCPGGCCGGDEIQLASNIDISNQQNTAGILS